MTDDSQPVFKKGDFVRFKHLAAVGVHPRPIRIAGVTLRGMLLLEDRDGPFAPKLFELAKESQDKRA